MEFERIGGRGEPFRPCGGTPQEPLWYKNEYLRRLGDRIQDRIDGLHNGSIHRDNLLVHGSRALLENLQARGLRSMVKRALKREAAQRSEQESRDQSGGRSSAPRPSPGDGLQRGRDHPHSDEQR